VLERYSSIQSGKHEKYKLRIEDCFFLKTKELLLRANQYEFKNGRRAREYIIH